MRWVVVLLVSASLSLSLGACSSIGLGCNLVIAAVPGDLVPSEGDALDPGWTVIAGPSDFDPATTTLGTDAESGAVTLGLRPAAADRMSAFTATNIGSYVAIAVDGRIASVPVIQAAIPDGVIQIQLSQDAGDLGEGNRRLEQCVS